EPGREAREGAGEHLAVVLGGESQGGAGGLHVVGRGGGDGDHQGDEAGGDGGGGGELAGHGGLLRGVFWFAGRRGRSPDLRGCWFAGVGGVAPTYGFVLGRDVRVCGLLRCRRSGLRPRRLLIFGARGVTSHMYWF